MAENAQKPENDQKPTLEEMIIIRMLEMLDNEKRSLIEKFEQDAAWDISVKLREPKKGSVFLRGSLPEADVLIDMLRRYDEIKAKASITKMPF